MAAQPAGVSTGSNIASQGIRAARYQATIPRTSCQPNDKDLKGEI